MHLQSLSKGIYSHSVELGDKKCYSVKAIGSPSLELETGGSIHLNNIVFVPGLNKKLLFISCLEDEGDRVSLVDGKFIVWGKISIIEHAKAFGIRQGKLYRFLKPLPQASLYLEINHCEL